VVFAEICLSGGSSVSVHKNERRKLHIGTAVARGGPETRTSMMPWRLSSVSPAGRMFPRWRRAFGRTCLAASTPSARGRELWAYADSRRPYAAALLADALRFGHLNRALMRWKREFTQVVLSPVRNEISLVLSPCHSSASRSMSFS
jgi:hypothetical protein